MRTIHKYAVSLTDEFTVRMPEFSQVLCTQMQRGEPWVWALVDTERPERERKFILCGTGLSAPDEPGPYPLWNYVGTFQMDNGFVGHLFVEDETIYG